MKTRRSQPIARSLAALSILAAILGSTLGATPAAASPSSCTSYVDASAAGADRSLGWDISIADSPRRCLQIRAGQTVRFVGDFSEHPLITDGGTTPNPIDSHDDAGNVTFASPGSYGFVCLIHSNMTGAIAVVAAGPTAVPASSGLRLVALATALVALGFMLRRRWRVVG